MREYKVNDIDVHFPDDGIFQRFRAVAQRNGWTVRRSPGAIKGSIIVGGTELEVDYCVGPLAVLFGPQQGQVTHLHLIHIPSSREQSF